MVTRIEAMQELARRGKLPADLKPYYDEAVKRGLIEGADQSLSPEAQAKARDALNEAGIRNLPLVGPVAGLALDAFKGGSESYGQQGLSGVNEGMATMVGAPVDLVTAGINYGVIPAINKATGSNIPQIESPIGGGESIKGAMSNMGMIKPETDDPGKQMVRRIGQDVGAAIVPGAPAVAGAAKPLAAAGELLASAASGGLGAAAAEQVAPGNPWLEIGAEIAGGLTPTALLRRAARKAAIRGAPVADELQAQKRAAYQQVDNLGVRYSPSGYQDMVQAAEQAAVKDHISPTRHPKAWSFLEDMNKRGKGGMTLTELDQLRQEVRRDVIRSGDEAEQHFGQLFLNEIDGFIAKASGSQVIAGSAPDANKAILAARELNTRWRKTEMIEDALYAADLKAASTGSGGNINNAIRQAFRSILLSDAKRRAFTAEELTLMERVVKGGAKESVLRLVGKLSPGGNGLMTALHIALTAQNPGMAAFAVGGAAAKMLGDAGTISRANTLRAAVASGNPNALRVPVTQDQRNVLAAVGTGMSANQLENALGTRNGNALRMNALN